MTYSTDSGAMASASSDLIDAPVVDTAGNQASIVGIEQQGDEVQAWVRLEQGTQVLLPLNLMTRQEDGAYRLPFAFRSASSESAAQMRIPVMEEEVQVGSRTVDTGRGVRLHKTVSEHEEVARQSLRHDELQIEHVAIGRMLDDGDVPQTRYEGDTLVVPVLEEVLVTQKRLLLREEVRVTRRQHEEPAEQAVLLRSEQLSVERFEDGRK